MPFTHDQFLDLFGVYNSQLWVAVLALWLVSAAAIVAYFRGQLTVVLAAALLAVHWAWSGVVYHGIYFTRINPAAWLFAALFVVEAGLFVRYAASSRRLTHMAHGRRVGRQWVADVFLVGALVYPGLVLVTGHTMPRAPLFAVPCPTMLVTAGLLLAMGTSVPRGLSVAPILWAAVGGYAAVAFGVLPDYLLFAAGLALVVAALAPGRLSHRRSDRGITSGVVSK
jgi:hypothetical protein